LDQVWRGVPMLKFDRVDHGVLRRVSFEIVAGEVCQVSLASEDQKRSFMTLIAGSTPPTVGKVFLFETDLFSVPEKTRLRLFQRIGVVPESGGLIGNLPAWENIILPCCYHLDMAAFEMEEKIKEFSHQMEFDGDDFASLLGRLPDELTTLQRISVSIMRAWLMQPGLLIYEFPYAGLNRDDLKRLLRLTRAYHTREPGRASVYLNPAEGVLSRQIETDKRIRLSDH
jgi:ABC-type transporter Mla maintaining outer membrane lipid asymmetry ATPase subunit MlaF